MSTTAPAPRARRKARISPTQRSKALLVERGYRVWIVERWNPFAKLRQDMYGWIDMVAIKAGEVLAIQATSDDNLAARMTKAEALPDFWLWLRAGGKAEFHGWGKRGARGEPKRWRCRIVERTEIERAEVEVGESCNAADEAI